MYPPLMKHILPPKTLSYKPTAIVIGQTGSGKTTLANKLCQTSHQAGAGKGSLTQNLFRNDVCVGMNPFSLIDTPGTDSSTEAYKHAFLLREGLTATPLNTIFFVVKFEHRFEKMIEIFYSQPIHYFKNKIVVMISHLDQSKNAKKDFDDICELFIEECPDVSNVCFFSELSPSESVASFMFSCISNMTAEKIEISDEDFQLNFNTFHTFQLTYLIRRSYQEYKNKANKLASDYRNYVCNNVINLEEDKDEILHMMMVQFRIDLDEMYDNFVRDYGKNMIDMDWYTFSIKMRKENIKLCNDFSEKVIPHMSYNLFDNQDPRNLIKQCPHCQLIWYKSEGCDGETTCGNRGFSVNSGSPIRAFFRYVIRYIDGIIKIQKNPNTTPTPATNRAIGNTSSAYKGCNMKIIWGDLPKLGDELILSLYKVKTMDEVKEIIKAEGFTKAKENYERSIDRLFHQ